MSWDHNINSVKCPCGCGSIEQDVRSDDWNRIEYGTPIIKCKKCSQTYKLITLSWHGPFSWNDRGSEYYLVPKDIDLRCEYINKYRDSKCNDINITEFSSFLIREYPKNFLLEVLNEVNAKKSVASLCGFAGEIAKVKKKRCRTAKIIDLRNDLKQALDHYDSFNGNYYQLEEEKKVNDENQRQYVKKVKTFGILIEL